MVHTVKIQNLNIEYYKKGSGPDLLFLHGGAGSFRSYLQFLDVLSKNFTVWAPSLPGAGKSSNLPRKWSFEMYATFVSDFINQFDMYPFIMGHSFGGAIAARSKNIFGGKMRDLVLISSAGAPAWERGTTATVSSVVIKQARHLLIGHPDVKKDIITNFLRHPIDVMRLILFLKKLDLTDDLKNLKERVIIIWGKQDEVLPRRLTKYFQKYIRDTKLFMLKGTHIFLNIQAKKIRGILAYEFTDNETKNN